MPADTTEFVAEHSARLQPSINLHVPVTAFMFSCSGTQWYMIFKAENGNMPEELDEVFKIFLKRIHKLTMGVQQFSELVFVLSKKAITEQTNLRHTNPHHLYSFFFVEHNFCIKP